MVTFGTAPGSSVFEGIPASSLPYPDPEHGTDPEPEEYDAPEETAPLPPIARNDTFVNVRVEIGSSYAGETVSVGIDALAAEADIDATCERLTEKATSLVEKRITYLREHARPQGGLPPTPAHQGFVQQAPLAPAQQAQVGNLPPVMGIGSQQVAQVAAGTHAAGGPQLQKMDSPNGKGFVSWYGTEVVSSSELVSAFEQWAINNGLKPGSFHIYDNREGRNSLADGYYSPFPVALKLAEGAWGYDKVLTKAGKPAVIAKADFKRTPAGPSIEFSFLADYTKFINFAGPDPR